MLPCAHGDRAPGSGRSIRDPRIYDEAVFPEAACVGDLNCDGSVDGADLGLLLSVWGGSAQPADLNADDLVDGADLGVLLAAWGPCV